MSYMHTFVSKKLNIPAEVPLRLLSHIVIKCCSLWSSFDVYGGHWWRWVLVVLGGDRRFRKMWRAEWQRLEPELHNTTLPGSSGFNGNPSVAHRTVVRSAQPPIWPNSVDQDVAYISISAKDIGISSLKSQPVPPLKGSHNCRRLSGTGLKRKGK